MIGAGRRVYGILGEPDVAHLRQEVVQGVRAIEYDYDANGNVIKTTQIGSDATTRTSFTSFDALNRPLQSIGPTYTGTFDEREIKVR